ncbi:MAG: hypothetical protein FWC09_03180 [Lachnospiraceae bacterium]|nr:hypothetical protein [Lachnospiraceae bacterium]
MTDKIIANLHYLFEECICTIKKASKGGMSQQPMTDSWLKVVNFDKMAKIYSKNIKVSILPSSNDALYICPNEQWFFIEFKDGSIDKAHIYRKIYDSLIILIELGIIPDFNFVRDHISYILVYNSEKLKEQEAQNRDRIFEYISDLAKDEVKLFGIEKFEKYLFKKAHTYSKVQFEEKFINVMEEQENLAIKDSQ